MQTKKSFFYYILLFLLLVAALVCCLQIPPQSPVSTGSGISIISKEWTLLTSNAPMEPDYVYEYTLAKGETRNLVFMKGFWHTLQAELNGEEIYSTQDTDPNNNISICWFPLPDRTDGATLTIRATTASSHAGDTIFCSVYLYDQKDFSHSILMQNFYALLFAVFAIPVGIVCILSGIYLKHQRTGGNHRAFLFLGCAIFFAGLWIVTDSDILLLFTPRVECISLLSYTTFMLMPAFLTLYTAEMSHGSPAPFHILSGLYFVNTLFYLSAYMLFPGFIGKLLYFQHGLIVCSIILILYRCVTEIRQYKSTTLKFISIGMAILSIFSVLALIMFYINPDSGYSLLYCTGIAALVICMVIAAVENLYSHLQDSANLAAYKQLAYLDSLTGLQNRTSFTKEQESPAASQSLIYILFDINNLKQTNDLYGHLQGDRLIMDAAECIRNTFNRIGKCYRIGGDEFVVIIHGNLSEKNILILLKQFEEKITEKNSQREFNLNVAYGYSIGEHGHNSREELFKEADRKMYENKNSGKINKKV